MIFNEANFEQEILESDVPVLLDFWAPWCRPCNAMTPVIEELEKEFEGKAKVGKINIDEESEIAKRHSVSAIPSFVLYKGGKIVKTIVGVQTKNNLKELVEELM
jgi:thioredoxin 1